LLPSGKVLVTGGLYSGFNVPVASAELYNPATGTWWSGANLAVSRYHHTATLLTNGTVFIAGGNQDGSFAELYDPVAPFINPITSPVKLADGSFQFHFSSPSGSSNHVLASTDFAAPLSTWLNLGNATETPPGSGQFQFADHQATNYPRRFYRVSSP
jgi:hypothetical protein